MSDTSAQKPKKPLNELLSHTLVDIYVGPDSTHWTLHEKLLCHHSPFFTSIFYAKENRASSSKSFGLPETDDRPFELLVGWLYSAAIRAPGDESEIGPLLDLYLLAVKFQIDALEDDVVDCVREFYLGTETYPGLRRVQYIYANTEEDNVMREMMVGSVARYLTLGERIPKHWEKALRNNGQLAVDIIRSIQEWHLEGGSVPDVREGSVRGFSSVVEEGSVMGESVGGGKEEAVNGH